MAKTLHVNIKSCEEQIGIALYAVTTNLQQIKALLKCEKTIMTEENNSTEDDPNEKIFKIEFDTATLIGILDHKDTCVGVILYMKEIGNITPYIEYCYDHYPFYSFLQEWRVNDFRIEIYTESKERFGLIIYFKNTLFNESKKNNVQCFQ